MRTPLGVLAFQSATPFASAFRDLQNTVGEDKIVAFTSSVPNEGATTAALCTAISAAQQGRSAIVVDCDVRRRSLTFSLGFDPDEGVLDASADPENWQNFVGEEDETGVHFMPGGRSRSPWRTISGAPNFSALLEKLRDHYDLVVLDCPPALGSPDTPMMASLAEKTIVVTAWDRTPISAVRTAMRALQRRPRAVTGVYVNRVPPEYRFGRLRGE
jgi:Mrp family chromosome partitioning ATPase